MPLNLGNPLAFLFQRRDNRPKMDGLESEAEIQDPHFEAFSSRLKTIISLGLNYQTEWRMV